MESSQCGIRPAAEVDAPGVAAIYNHYIGATVATFEETPLTDAEMAERIRASGPPLAWLVAVNEDSIDGYAFAAPWKPRNAYRYTAETSVYLHPEACGRGLGERLYGALLERLAAQGIHCVIGSIALPNPASVALHEKLGFRRTGALAQVGWKQGRWVDVGYWQRILGDDEPAT